MTTTKTKKPELIRRENWACMADCIGTYYKQGFHDWEEGDDYRIMRYVGAGPSSFLELRAVKKGFLDVESTLVRIHF